MKDRSISCGDHAQQLTGVKFLPSLSATLPRRDPSLHAGRRGRPSRFGAAGGPSSRQWLEDPKLVPIYLIWSSKCCFR